MAFGLERLVFGVTPLRIGLSKSLHVSFVPAAGLNAKHLTLNIQLQNQNITSMPSCLTGQKLS